MRGAEPAKREVSLEKRERRGALTHTVVTPVFGENTYTLGGCKLCKEVVDTWEMRQNASLARYWHVGYPVLHEGSPQRWPL